MTEENENLTKASIGKTLKEARVANGYTLDDLQKNTKIQKRYLIAIEEDKFDELPGEFYVRAFVKQYADSVGLDGNELLSQANDKLPNAKTAELPNDSNGVAGSEKRSEQRPFTEERDFDFKRYIPIVAVSLIVILILIAIWVAASRNTHNASQTKIDSSSVTVSSSSAKTKKAKTESVDTKTKKAAKKTKAKKNTEISFKKTTVSGSNLTYSVSGIAKEKKLIKISATESAWTSVTVDGASKWQGSQTTGQKKTISLPADTTAASIQMGNAKGTKLSINGKALKLAAPAAGSSDQVRTVTIDFK